MENIIKKLESISLSGADILKICSNKSNLIPYSDLSNYNNIDEALGPYTSCILLYETKLNYGHWCCIFKVDKNTLEFFDPYGEKVDEQLKHIPQNMRKSLNEEIPHLSYLLINSPYDVIYNKKKIQKLETDINTCGRHCAFRIVMRSLPLDDYIDLFQNQKQSADFWVSALTAFL